MPLVWSEVIKPTVAHCVGTSGIFLVSEVGCVEQDVGLNLLVLLPEINIGIRVQRKCELNPLQGLLLYPACLPQIL